jgi:hypothetical protein
MTGFSLESLTVRDMGGHLEISLSMLCQTRVSGLERWRAIAEYMMKNSTHERMEFSGILRTSLNL